MILVEEMPNAAEADIDNEVPAAAEKTLTAKPIANAPVSGPLAEGMSAWIVGESVVQIALIFGYEGRQSRHIWLGVLSRHRLKDSSPVEHMNTVTWTSAGTPRRDRLSQFHYIQTQ